MHAGRGEEQGCWRENAMRQGVGCGALEREAVSRTSPVAVACKSVNPMPPNAAALWRSRSTT